MGRKITFNCDSMITVKDGNKGESNILDSVKAMLSKTNATLRYVKGKDKVLGDFTSQYYAPTYERVQPLFNQNSDNQLSLDNLQDIQKDDDKIQQTILQVSKGESVSDPFYAKMQSHLFISKGALYVRHFDRLLAIIPENKAEDFILQTHLDPMHMHIKAFKLEHKLRQYVYILNISSKIKDVINRCGICLQADQLPLVEERAALRLREPAKSLLDHIHLDLHGPWHCGNKKFYIWGATCAFSKYLFCGITRSKKASSAFKFLMNKVIFFAGVPNTITSDRGAEFSTKVIDYLHKALGIQRIKTSAYHPSSNSSIERYWRSLDQQLRKSTTNYADIEDILIPASFALNSTVNSTTGYAPNYLLMAFTPQTATLFNKFPPIPADVQQNDPDMILEREQRRLKAFQEVHKRIRARANYNKSYHDARGTQTVREVGDQCLIKNHHIPIHANKKIVPRWKPATKGLPYQIIKASEDGLNLKLLDPTTGKQIDCHTENTRKLPGGKIYPLPKEGPTA